MVVPQSAASATASVPQTTASVIFWSTSLPATIGMVTEAVPSMLTPEREMSPDIAIEVIDLSYVPVTWMPSGLTSALAEAESPIPATDRSPARPTYQLV